MKGTVYGKMKTGYSGAYLFVHFIGMEKTPLHEQVYFSISKDGRNWDILNGGKPVLVSNVGEQGARDPFIQRSPDGGMFFIIATDLSIFHRMQKQSEKIAWSQCTNGCADNPNPGSRSMIVWKSEDLLSWSKAELVKIAPDRAGCFWAPKSVWDRKKKKYMVMGASKMPQDNYGWLRLYRCYTEDFKTFSPVELYIDFSSNTMAPWERKHIFDCTIMENKEKYYRIYKTDRIQIDMADSLDGKWSQIETNIHVIAPNHEGPAACRENGKESWLLMLDNLSTRGGYQLFTTDCLQGGRFYIDDNKVSFPGKVKYRHGSILPITEEEFVRLKEGYSE